MRVACGLALFAAVWLAHLAYTSLSIPVDDMERLLWVRALEWGYYKHPPLAALMESFDRDFGLQHRTTLDAIANRLALDHVILDCGHTPDGRLLLFEADSRGWIHATDPVDRFP